MAQRDTKPTYKESAAMKERPSSKKLQTSLSQPASSDPTNQQKPTPRRYLTLPITLNNNYSLSPAERYIACQAQILNEQQDISPETPSSITGVSINSTQSLMSYAERMHKWHQEETRKICKKQKHRYVYGTAPSSSIVSPTSLGLQFSPSTPLNNIQSSMPPTHTTKKG